jgi:hypothetical protein
LEGDVGDEANSEIRTKRQRGMEKRGGKAPVAESPFGADSEARNLAVPDHLVNRGWVNSE